MIYRAERDLAAGGLPDATGDLDERVHDVGKPFILESHVNSLFFHRRAGGFPGRPLLVDDPDAVKQKVRHFIHAVD